VSVKLVSPRVLSCFVVDSMVLEEFFFFFHGPPTLQKSFQYKYKQGELSERDVLESKVVHRGSQTGMGWDYKAPAEGLNSIEFYSEVRFC